jgi:DNA-binding MarR family transcriptional regulator
MDLMHPFNCLTFNLQRATRSLMRGFEAAAKDSGLTAPQFTTLSLMAGFGEVSVTQIAGKLGTDRTTMTRNLEVLARKGWIAEVPSTDGRLHVWTLTAAGKDRLAVALPVWRAFQAGLVERIGEGQVRSILETLTKI